MDATQWDIFGSLGSPFESDAGQERLVSASDVWEGLPAFPATVSEPAARQFQDWFNASSSRIVLLTGVWPRYVPGVDWAPRQGPVFPALLLSAAASSFPSRTADLWVTWLLS
jgi:hypothetical protein